MPERSLRSSAGVRALEETAGFVGSGGHGKQMDRIAFALHEMCQPVMTLQCRLEIGKMVGTAEGYEEAVREALVECDRLLRSVDVLRKEVVRGLEDARSL